MKDNYSARRLPPKPPNPLQHLGKEDTTVKKYYANKDTLIMAGERVKSNNYTISKDPLGL